MSPGSWACFHGCVVLGVFEWAGQLACSTLSTRVLLFNCLGAAAPRRGRGSEKPCKAFTCLG